MKLVTIEEVRNHCKADGDDDELLVTYANAAEAMCARLANRAIFATSDELSQAVAGIPSRMTAAYAAYDEAMEMADGADDDRVAVMMRANAQVVLANVTLQCEGLMHGIALDSADGVDGTPGEDAIKSAVLMAAGHWYRNRESVTAGQGAAAIEVPMSTQQIMSHYRWLGDI